MNEPEITIDAINAADAIGLLALETIDACPGLSFMTIVATAITVGAELMAALPEYTRACLATMPHCCGALGDPHQPDCVLSPDGFARLARDFPITAASERRA